MKKIDKLEEKIERGVFKHEQHTKQFTKELNKPKDVSEPFRIMDMKWKVGKYKGVKIENTPDQYIEWVLTNFKNLSNSHKTLLEAQIQKK